MSHLSKRDLRQAEYTAYVIERLRDVQGSSSDLAWRGDVITALCYMFELVTGVSWIMYVEDVDDAQSRLLMVESILEDEREADEQQPGRFTSG